MLKAILSPYKAYDIAIEGQPIGRFVVAWEGEGFTKLQNEKGEHLIVEINQTPSDLLTMLQGNQNQEVNVIRISNSLMPVQAKEEPHEPM